MVRLVMVAQSHFVLHCLSLRLAPCLSQPCLVAPLRLEEDLRLWRTQWESQAAPLAASEVAPYCPRRPWVVASLVPYLSEGLADSPHPQQLRAQSGYLEVSLARCLLEVAPPLLAQTSAS